MLLKNRYPVSCPRYFIAPDFVSPHPSTPLSESRYTGQSVEDAIVAACERRFDPEDAFEGTVRNSIWGEVYYLASRGFQICGTMLSRPSVGRVGSDSCTRKPKRLRHFLSGRRLAPVRDSERGIAPSRARHSNTQLDYSAIAKSTERMESTAVFQRGDANAAGTWSCAINKTAILKVPPSSIGCRSDKPECLRRRVTIRGVSYESGMVRLDVMPDGCRCSCLVFPECLEFTNWTPPFAHPTGFNSDNQEDSSCSPHAAVGRDSELAPLESERLIRGTISSDNRLRREVREEMNNADLQDTAGEPNPAPAVAERPVQPGNESHTAGDASSFLVRSLTIGWEGVEAWQVPLQVWRTRKEYLELMLRWSKDRRIEDLLRAWGGMTSDYAHKYRVEEAVKMGKAVPAQVLSDYPDLISRYCQANDPCSHGRARPEHPD